MANTIGSTTGFIAPYMVGVLTVHQTQEEWQKVFIVTAVVYLIGAIVYVVLCKGDLEPWANVNKKSNTVEDGEDEPLREN
jgi:dipeptide/tripeptide permease